VKQGLVMIAGIAVVGASVYYKRESARNSTDYTDVLRCERMSWLGISVDYTPTNRRREGPYVYGRAPAPRRSVRCAAAGQHWGSARLLPGEDGEQVGAVNQSHAGDVGAVSRGWWKTNGETANGAGVG
jgi:hypothetical protein